jgi:tRNA pseudouridine38-40 synthase
LRYRATVAYDGGAYQGFQRQRAGVPTVQAEIEAVLAKVSQAEKVPVLAAGRTDAGVHATGQVIAFELPAWRHGPEILQRALNATLPPDIAVWALEETRPDFHPRFDARSRTYRYVIRNALVRHPLERLRAWHVHEPLDVAAMSLASEALIGEHDFGTFGTSLQGEATWRVVYRAEWNGYPEENGGGMLYAFIIEANAFLYRMVRSLVGTFREVGAGRMTVEGFRECFAACDRSLAAASAPAHGLTLISVNY